MTGKDKAEFIDAIIQRIDATFYCAEVVADELISWGVPRYVAGFVVLRVLSTKAIWRFAEMIQS